MTTNNVNFHNKIANLCLTHFKSLPKSGKPTEKEWTVLSCIVLEIDNNFQVISLGTGSKCIGRNQMHMDGYLLNDSHAEVICRRAFLRYLYEQILDCQNLEKSLITFNITDKQFEIKNGARFHFFTTHIPCGDATIFPKNNPSQFGNLILERKKRQIDIDEVEKNNKRLKLETDIYRTGAKCLESEPIQDQHLPGSEYHVVGLVRTKPGRGDPTLSVSCSDKLAKWYHLGLQGALLNILIEKPIYLDSFTIVGGMPFSREALERAIFKRFDKIQLNSTFRPNKLLIGQAEVIFEFNKNEEKNACPNSIYWLNTNRSKSIEIAVEGRRQGITKKQMNTSVVGLKLCKFVLFKYFIEIVKKFDIKLNQIVELKSLRYVDAKMLAVDYQKAWCLLKESFKKWPSKREELLYFSVK